MFLLSAWCYILVIERWIDASVQFSSATQSCLTLCDPMDCSTPGLPVHHHLPEFTQTHVPWVCDAIQPSHPLSSPFPPAFDHSQHQGLSKRVSSSHQVAFYFFPLGWTGWIFLQSKGLSTVFSNTTLQKHQLLGTQPSSWANSHPYMTTGKTIALTEWTFVSKVMSLLFNVLSRFVMLFFQGARVFQLNGSIHHPQGCWSPRK